MLVRLKFDCSLSTDDLIFRALVTLSHCLNNSSIPSIKLHASGVGPPHPESIVRRFGSNDSILTVLYCDSALWCPYSASVLMTLEELRLPYKVKRVNLLAYGEKPDWWYRVSSTGLLPVLEVDGRIIRESRDICLFANYFAGSRVPKQARPMYPEKDDALHPVAERLLELERDLYRDFFVYVFEGPEAKGKEQFLGTLKEVEAALGAYPDAGPWFLPSAEPSVVDCIFAPKIERMVAACLYFKALRLRDRAAYPNLCCWLDALDARQSFAAFKSDFYSCISALEPLFGRAYAVHTSEAQEIRARIDGVHPTAWRLPFSAEEVALEPAPNAFPSGADARQAAAVRLILNHKRLPPYMLRALGRPGKAYRSVLADPFNEPDQRFAPAIDKAYRYLVLALLRGHEAVEPLLRADVRATNAAYGDGSMDSAAARARVVACLEYLRERISVPRDMTLSEARQLRAHINWLADELR